MLPFEVASVTVAVSAAAIDAGALVGHAVEPVPGLAGALAAGLAGAAEAGPGEGGAETAEEDAAAPDGAAIGGAGVALPEQAPTNRATTPAMARGLRSERIVMRRPPWRLGTRCVRRGGPPRGGCRRGRHLEADGCPPGR